MTFYINPHVIYCTAERHPFTRFFLIIKFDYLFIYASFTQYLLEESFFVYNSLLLNLNITFSF